MRVLVLFLIAFLFLSGCFSTKNSEFVVATVAIPTLQLADTGECYYLDDFMPTPESLIEGKSGGLYTRHYSYKGASFKEYARVNMVLSFYSSDKRCWSLFRESIIPRK